jgi:putative ABC transport system substrate-binding protein
MSIRLRRREVIAALGGAAAWPLGARAQQPAKRARIGLLFQTSAATQADRIDAFRAGLRDLGYMEGKDFVIESRWSEGQYERLPNLAAELARLNVDVIVAQGTPAVLAAKQATTTIPIVMTGVGDAEASGLVPRLSRPGANVTGMSFFLPELAAKRIEMLKEFIPNLTDVAILSNPDNRVTEVVMPEIRLAGRTLYLNLHGFTARRPAEFADAFSQMAASRVGALLIVEDSVLVANSIALADFALKQRLPASGSPEFAIAGGLVGYGVDLLDMWRRVPIFVDKLLKGANPGDLPVERSTKFRTALNLKTAKTLGLNIPAIVYARADEVIE